MNYYERYCGDYGRDTAHLSLAEHGAYTLMLDAYYSTERGLPADVGALCRMCRAVSKAEQASVRNVAEQFFPVGQDGLRHNARAAREIPKARKRIDAAKANGTRGGRPHKPNANPLGYPSGIPPGNPDQTQQQTHPGEASPCTTRHTPEVQEQPALAAPHPPKKRRRTSLQDGWEMPAAWLEWAQNERREWDHEHVLRVSLTFRDHFIGNGETMADWLAAWRKWVRRERDKTNSKEPTLAERRSAHWADIIGSNQRERTITDTDALGGAPVHPVLSDLRKQDGDDVARHAKGGTDDDVE